MAGGSRFVSWGSGTKGPAWRGGCAGRETNRCTVQMLCTCALALVRDRERLPDHGGVLTPAVAFGDVLIERLKDQGMVWRSLAWVDRGDALRCRS